MILDQRKIIARRCALELRAGAIVNLESECRKGSRQSQRKERSELFTLTAEPGVIGGVPPLGSTSARQ